MTRRWAKAPTTPSQGCMSITPSPDPGGPPLSSFFAYCTLDFSCKQWVLCHARYSTKVERGLWTPWGGGGRCHLRVPHHIPSTLPPPGCAFIKYGCHHCSGFDCGGGGGGDLGGGGMPLLSSRMRGDSLLRGIMESPSQTLKGLEEALSATKCAVTKEPG